MTAKEYISDRSDQHSTDPSRNPDSLEDCAAARLSEEFVSLMRHIQDRFPIHRGVLIVSEPNHSRFVAVATVKGRKERKRLNLRLPGTSSLIEKVAEHGQMFSDCSYDLFSGNRFERNLLIDEETRAYAVLPLKHDARIVGLVGFSATEDSAFAAIEEGSLTRELDRLSLLAAEANPLPQA